MNKSKFFFVKDGQALELPLNTMKYTYPLFHSVGIEGTFENLSISLDVEDIKQNGAGSVRFNLVRIEIPVNEKHADLYDYLISKYKHTIWDDAFLDEISYSYDIVENCRLISGRFRASHSILVDPSNFSHKYSCQECLRFIFETINY